MEVYARDSKFRHFLTVSQRLQSAEHSVYASPVSEFAVAAWLTDLAPALSSPLPVLPISKQN